MDTANRDKALRVNEPLRPDLAPGRSVTAVPDMWCPYCAKARGGRTCGVCGSQTCSPPAGEATRVHEQYRAAAEEPREADGASVGARVGEVDERPTGRARLPWLVRAAERPQRASVAAPVERVDPSPDEQPTLSERPRSLRLGSNEQQPTRGSNMSRDTFSRKQDFDEGGRPIHRVGGRRSPQMSADKLYRQQWAEDKIDKNRWTRLMAGALAGVEATPEAVALAGRVADLAYIELMMRERDQLDDI